MSRTPVKKIDSDKIKQVLKMNHTNATQICRECNWSHDYLNQRLREGKMGFARLEVLSKRLGVSDEFFLAQEDDPCKFYVPKDGETEKNAFNDLLRKIDNAIKEYLQDQESNGLIEYQFSFEPLK